MKTKHKILREGCKLFNLHSSPAVSTRMVASAVGISQGNLCYHFKNTEEIVLTLFGEMYELMINPLNHLFHEKSSLENALESYDEILRIQYRYRFLFREMAVLTRKLPPLALAYKNFREKREHYLVASLYDLNQRGFLLSESFPGEYAMLTQHFFLVFDLWPADATLKKLRSSRRYLKMSTAFLYPYLTEKGQNALMPHLI